MPAASQEHLISIANFDTTNQAQLAQIAHHNAQILRHIKGNHHAQPVTQYHNPFPLYQQPNGKQSSIGVSPAPIKHFIVQTNPAAVAPVDHRPAAETNMLTSSSNIAQTIIPHMSLNPNFLGKPSFLGKSNEMSSHFKFLNSIHPSTAKIPGIMKAVSITPNFHSPVFSSTTSRVPIIRYIII